VNGRVETVKYFLELLKGKLTPENIKEILQSIDIRFCIPALNRKNIPLCFDNETSNRIDNTEPVTEELVSVINLLYGLIPLTPYQSRILMQFPANEYGIQKLLNFLGLVRITNQM